MDNLDQLQTDLLAEVEAADLAALEALRVSALGKSGSITEMVKGIGQLPAEERRDAGQKLQERDDEIIDLRARLDELSNVLSKTRSELEQSQSDLESTREQSTTTDDSGASNDMMMTLVQEMATLKANLANQQQAAPAAAPDFSDALDKLTGSLNDRL